MDTDMKTATHPAIDYCYVILTALTHGILFLFRGSFAPITDALEKEFNTTSAGIGILSSSYYITYVVVQIPWGLFLQTFTCELALIIAAFSGSILSLIFPFATLASNPIIVGSIIRGLAGICTAQTWISGITLAGHKFGNNYVTTCTAIMMFSASLHLFIGNLIQAQIYEKYNSWEITYYFIAILSFIYGSLLVLCVCKERNISDISFKRLPTCTNTYSSFSKLSEQEIDNMTHLSICQQLTKNMVLSIKMYLNWFLGLFGFCGASIFFGGVLLWFVPYLMAKYNYSRSLATIIAGIPTLTQSVVSIIFGECTRRIKKRKIFLIICSFLYLSVVILIYVPNIPLSVVIILTVIIGVAVSCFAIIFTLGREYNWYYGNAETATGLINMIMFSAGFVGQYTIGALLDLHYEQRSNIDKNREYIVADYNFAFIIFPICTGCAIIFSFLLKETNGININYGSSNIKNKQDCNSNSQMTQL